MTAAMNTTTGRTITNGKDLLAACEIMRSARSHATPNGAMPQRFLRRRASRIVGSAITRALTLEVSGRCHSECQITVARRSGPLDRIVSPGDQKPWMLRQSRLRKPALPATRSTSAQGATMEAAPTTRGRRKWHMRIASPQQED